MTASSTIGQGHGHRGREKDITRSELYMADEVFMTGTAAEISPIRSIDNRLIIGEARSGRSPSSWA
ncbi:MAG: hypothetical protein MZV70_44595 [Desulfobacterales bacterium]|nr:hypothetical protein [Desulfobacterales bacterium]